MTFLRKKTWFIWTALLLVSTASLFGQGTTGRLSGNVTLENAPLPGVTVTVSAPTLQGVRTAITDVNGNYNLGALPPGRYNVSFEMEGMTTVAKTAEVNLTAVARADADMRLSAMAEAITITADSPSIVAETQVQSDIDADLVENLPMGRTLVATVNLAPGVTANGVRAGSLVISGAPSYDNTFYINGSVVNEVLRGQPLDLFIEDALQETSVLQGAISAEYGRFTGGVVTAISKSGGNEFTGSLRDSFTNPKWNEATPLEEDRNDKLSETYEGTLGGRIIRDRLWFFGAGRYVQQSQENFFLQSTEPYNTDREQTRIEGKLTGSLTTKHTLVGSYLDLTDDLTGRCLGNGGCWEPRTLATLESLPQTLLSLNYSGILTNNLLVEGNFADSELQFIGSGGQRGSFAESTNIFFAAVGGFGGAPSFCGNCTDESRKTEAISLKGTYYLSTAGLGTHNIVGGVEDFSEQLLSNNNQSGSDFTVWTFNAPQRAADGTLLPVFGRNAGFIIYWPILELSQGNDQTTQSAFINDKWDLNRHLSFNLGARYDQNDGKDSSGATVADDSKFSPRLGVTYDVRGDGRIRLNASYSEYVSKISNGNIGDAASPAGSPSYLYWLYAGPTIRGLDSQAALAAMDVWFQGIGGINNRTPGVFLGGGANGIQTQIPQTLKSPAVNEVALGVGYAFSNNGYVRFDVQDRKWSDFYTTRTDQTTGRVDDPLANAEVDLSIVQNSNDFVREYQAAIVQAGYRLFNRVNIGGNYTWSELTGNHRGETGGAGPIADTGRNYYPEFLSYEQNNPVGFLPEDQTHKLRAWASFDLATRVGNFNFSALQRFDSGTPYSAIGSIDVEQSNACPQCPENADLYVSVPSGVNYFFSDRGEFRWDDLTATDLALNYALPIGKLELFIQGELLNVFNESAQVFGDQTVETAFDDPFDPDDNPTGLRAFNPFTETPVEGVHYRLGANFGEPLTPTTQATQGDFQLPRTYRFSAGIRF